MSSVKLAEKVSVALDQLAERLESGAITNDEYDNRMFAICVWAKRRIFHQVLDISKLTPANYPTLSEFMNRWSVH
jgi:hypothetical protein